MSEVVSSEPVTGHASITVEFVFGGEIDEYGDVVWPEEYTRAMAKAALIALRDEYRRISRLIDDGAYGQAGHDMGWDNLDPHRHDPDPTTEGEIKGYDAPPDVEAQAEMDGEIDVVDLTPADVV